MMLLLATYPTNYLHLALAAIAATAIILTFEYWQQRRLSTPDHPLKFNLGSTIAHLVVFTVIAYVFNYLAQAIQRAEISLMTHGAPPSLLSISLNLAIILWLLHCLLMSYSYTQKSPSTIQAACLKSLLILLVLALTLGLLA